MDRKVGRDRWARRAGADGLAVRPYPRTAKKGRASGMHGRGTDSCRGLFGVAAAQHAGEGHDLLLAAAAFRGLLGITLHADILYDVLSLELLLHAALRPIHRLVFYRLPAP